MNTSSRKIQIGVMGSMADLNYAKATEKLAQEVGFWIAKNGATLVFGAEKDADSLSTAACRGAKRAGGLTVGVTYGKGLDIYEKNDVDVVIASGLERGGGRELTLALSCDAIIALNGGSGTLTEIAIAYQANIPVVVLPATGGWSKKLAGKYLDDRKRIKAEVAKSPKEAVGKALRLIESKRKEKKDVLVITATHGDEPIGVTAMKIIDKNLPINRFSWLIANDKALKLNKRFIETDLNRVAPGNKIAKEYETKRAAELLKIADNFKYVVDIHGTTANTGIFTIVTNPTLQNLAFASALPVKNIVLWSSANSQKSGPLTRFTRCGLEIECGPKNHKKILNQLIDVLKSINKINPNPSNLSFEGKNLYKVYGKLSKQEVSNKKYSNFKDFNKVSVEKETFFPLLVGQYKDLVCYKMQKVELSKLISY